MIELVISISEINYSAVVGKVSGIVKLISKPVPEAWKRKLVIKVTKRFGNVIIQKMNNFLCGEGVLLMVKGLDIIDATSSDKELEFHLSFDDINYAALMSKAWEKLQNFSGNEKLNRVFELLDKSGVALKILDFVNALPQDVKNELVAGIVSIYEKEIISQLNSFAKNEDWKVTLSGLEVKKL